MLNKVKRLCVCLLAAVLLVGSLTLTSADAAMKKPGNCHFVRWNNTSFTSCRIAWGSVRAADYYEVKWTYTDGSNYKHGAVSAYYTGCDISGLAYNHVYQAQVRGLLVDSDGYIYGYGNWSNLVFITPWPRSSSASFSGSNVKLKWNIIYGSSGYNIFMTTNPSGTWYWNQSTPTYATSTSATIRKYRGSKLKKYSNYYVRIITRRVRNGVFCTVPEPYSSYYSGRLYTGSLK